MDSFDFENFTNVHLIGIGGISMSGIAQYFLSIKKIVSGSDLKPSSITSSLVKNGVRFFPCHKESNLDGLKVKDTIIVYTSAIDDKNPELSIAKNEGFTVYKRSEILSLILKCHKKTIMVSGSHGKTTTTALLTEIFSLANKNPTAFLGGESVRYSNFLLGGKEIAIAEACEYKKNLLDFKPNYSVVLNLDMDHHDSYCSERDYIDTFKKFAQNGISFINVDDKKCQEIAGLLSVTFGIKNKACYMAKSLKKGEDGYSFTAYSFNRPRGRINLKIKGKFNVYNALSAFAVADVFNIPFSIIKEGIENFSGVKRRAEKIGEIKNRPVVCDYAHHPKEIKETLNALEKDGTLVVFQPHTYSRTKAMMKEFVDALKETENLIIYKTYPAREEFDEEGSAFALYHNLKGVNKGKVVYANSESELILKIKGCCSFSDLLVLGAGDVYETAKKMTRLKEFKNKSV